MSPAVSPSIYDAPELYDLLFDSFDLDIPYWLEAARNAGGPVLEAACGTGRVMLPVLRAGIEVDGFDSSPAMIARLKAKARAEGLSVRAGTADMRTFDMGRRYAAVFCAFNGFAHCGTIDDQLAFLRRSLDHLRPGGALFMHMSYPGPAYWLEPEGEAVLERTADRPGGGRIELWDNRRKDIVAQRQESEVEIREFDGAGRSCAAHRFSTSQRWVYRYELELLFRAAGFARWEVLGGTDGHPLRAPDDLMTARAFKD